MKRLVAILFSLLVPALAAGGCGSKFNANCTSTFTPCGGSIVGTWAIQDACGSTANALEKQCPGATFDFSVNDVSGMYAFKAGGTYSTSINIDTSGTMTLPASCLTGLTDCSKADQMFDAEGLNISISCTGNAAESCTCTIAEKGTVTSTGTYTTAKNDVSMTPNGATSSTPQGYCVTDSTLQIGMTSSGNTYILTFSKQ